MLLLFDFKYSKTVILWIMTISNNCFLFYKSVKLLFVLQFSFKYYTAHNIKQIVI